jgi:hypothetical protein
MVTPHEVGMGTIKLPISGGRTESTSKANIVFGIAAGVNRAALASSQPLVESASHRFELRGYHGLIMAADNFEFSHRQLKESVFVSHIFKLPEVYSAFITTIEQVLYGDITLNSSNIDGSSSINRPIYSNSSSGDGAASTGFMAVGF